MQKIKQFSDIHKYFQELNQDRQERFLLETDQLIIKLLQEQESANTLSALENLKGSLNKPVSNLPPPPPPLPPKPLLSGTPDNSGLNPLKIRGVGGAPLPTANFSSSFGVVNNKKRFLALAEAMGYIEIILTDYGKEAIGPRSTLDSESYRILKLVASGGSLKEIYLIDFSTKMSAGKFMEKIYLLAKEKYFVFRKKQNLQEGEEVNARLGDFLMELNLIDQKQLDYAISVQKGEVALPKEEAVNNNTNSQMLSISQQILSKINTTPTTNAPRQRVLLGNVLIDLKYISKEQLEHTLNIQRWFKHLFDSLR